MGAAADIWQGISLSKKAKSLASCSRSKPKINIRAECWLTLRKITEIDTLLNIGNEDEAAKLWDIFQKSFGDKELPYT